MMGLEKVIAFIWSFLLIFVPVSSAEEMKPEKKEQLINVTALTGGAILTSLFYTGRKKYQGAKKEKEQERNL